MKGTLKNRPVGLSKTQFECAQRNQDGYWLYVVEEADTKDARIIRIKDPAGQARTFTFDHGWVAIAEKEESDMRTGALMLGVERVSNAIKTLGLWP